MCHERSRCRRSSVVERTIGNGEVESSILSGGTTHTTNPDVPVSLRYRQLTRRLVVNADLTAHGL